MKYTKEQARRIVLNCAKLYRDRLLNRNLLVIYRDREDHKVHDIEITFYERNYQHLTGLELVDAEGRVIRGQSVNFYRKCVENRLSLKEIRFRPDGTAQLKLTALPYLMDLTRITKITGDYNRRQPYLKVDKVLGGVNFCLGLTRSGGMYVPSSALLKDIKRLSDNTSQVLMILERGKTEKMYTTIRYTARGVNYSSLCLPDEIAARISLPDSENTVTKDQEKRTGLLS
ncbi:MAG: PBECR4 domain-containing protein [Lachnospiraceae bacterium]